MRLWSFLPLVLLLLVSGAAADSVLDVGIPGADGGPGAPGERGGDATAEALGNLSVESATATGGGGGDAGAPAGSDLDGGDGGSAEANSSASATGFVNSDARSTARGGSGGDARLQGKGGRGGDAIGQAESQSEAGTSRAEVNLTAGAGGISGAGGGAADGTANAVSGAGAAIATGRSTGGDAGPNAVSGEPAGSARVAVTSSATSGRAVSNADAFGGDGGEGAFAGANGTQGGAADARATASGPASGSSARSRATGGDGGDASGGAAVAGSGGDATASAAAASTQTTSADAQAVGGAGGDGEFGADGGDGGNATMHDAVSGSSTNRLSLVQIATGGAGGDSTGGGSGGDGGSAESRLSVSDLEGALATVAITAVGGAAGDGAPSGVGGDAAISGSAAAVGATDLTLVGAATGGFGGGEASFTAPLFGRSDSGDVRVDATLRHGGVDPTGPTQDGLDAMGTDLVGGETSGALTLEQELIAGNGRSGGNGGEALSSLTASGARTATTVTATATGGTAAAGDFGGGDGGDADAHSTASNPSGSATANARATAGRGAQPTTAGAGPAGRAGSASSQAIAEADGDGAAHADSEARGGFFTGPAVASDAGLGGDADAFASAEARGTGTAFANSEAFGGGGGNSSGAGAPGPMASAVAEATSLGGGSASAFALAEGGRGSNGPAAGDGQEAQASAFASAAMGADARSSVTQEGGRGGSGTGSSMAGEGGDSELRNAARGQTTGNLTLSQSAIGGAAGFADTPAAGARGGDALSELVVDHLGAGNLSLTSRATGGRGSLVSSGAAAGPGGAATSHVRGVGSAGVNIVGSVSPGAGSTHSLLLHGESQGGERVIVSGSAFGFGLVELRDSVSGQTTGQLDLVQLSSSTGDARSVLDHDSDADVLSIRADASSTGQGSAEVMARGTGRGSRLTVLGEAEVSGSSSSPTAGSSASVDLEGTLHGDGGELRVGTFNSAAEGGLYQGHANSRSVGTATGDSIVEVESEAVAGNAIADSAGNAGPVDAVATAFGSNQGSSLVTVGARAVGSEGSFENPDGGLASASAHGTSTLGNVSVRATQQGGDGARAASGEGAGGDSVLIDAATGSTAGTLFLTQTATGGGAKTGGTGGHAVSLIDQTNPGGGGITGKATAIGGSGTSFRERAREGGNARAGVRVEALGSGQASAEAIATAGTSGSGNAATAQLDPVYARSGSGSVRATGRLTHGSGSTGDGPSAFLDNRVDADSSGPIRLFQTATAGSGAIDAKGGDATSILSKIVDSELLDVQTIARAGSGADGGDARAESTARNEGEALANASSRAGSSFDGAGQSIARGGDAISRALAQSGDRGGAVKAVSNANGGAGARSVGPDAAGAAGGDATSHAEGVARVGGQVNVSSHAGAGTGGSFGGVGVAGGDAHASALAIGRGSEPVFVATFAFAGAGGSGTSQAGAPGTATGTAEGRSEGGGNVRASLHLEGGAGGSSSSGGGTDGGSIDLENAVSGTTTGRVQLTQRAVGGRAGGQARGGDARSVLESENPTGGGIELLAEANGGSGSSGTSGGDAFAEAVARDRVGGDVVAVARSVARNGGTAELGRVFGSSDAGGSVEVEAEVEQDGPVRLDNRVTGATRGSLLLRQEAVSRSSGAGEETESLLEHRGAHESLQLISQAEGRSTRTRTVAFNESGDARARSQSSASDGIAVAYTEASAVADGSRVLVGNSPSSIFFVPRSSLSAAGRSAISESVGRHFGDGEVRVFDRADGFGGEATSTAIAENAGFSPVLASAFAGGRGTQDGASRSEATARGFGRADALAVSDGSTSGVSPRIAQASAIGSSGSASAVARGAGIGLSSTASVASFSRATSRLEDGAFGLVDAVDAFATGVVNASPETLDDFFEGSPRVSQAFSRAERILGAAQLSTDNSQAGEIVLSNAITIESFIGGPGVLVGLVGLEAQGSFDELRISLLSEAVTPVRPEPLLEFVFTDPATALAQLQDRTIFLPGAFTCVFDCAFIPALRVEVSITTRDVGSTTTLGVILGTSVPEASGIMIVTLCGALLATNRRRRSLLARAGFGATLLGSAILLLGADPASAVTSRSEVELACPTQQGPLVAIDELLPIELTAINEMSFATVLSAATPAVATSTAIPVATAPASTTPILEGIVVTSRFGGSPQDRCEGDSLGVLEQDYEVVGADPASLQPTLLEIGLSGGTTGRLDADASLLLEIDLVDPQSGQTLVRVGTILLQPDGVVVADGLDLSAVETTTSVVAVPGAESAATEIRGVATALLDISPTDSVGLRRTLRASGDLQSGGASVFLVESASSRMLTTATWTALTDGVKVVPLTARPGDRDGDGVADAVDNCVDAANPGQNDVDEGADDDASIPGAQHYGDVCDFDLDNDGFVGASDFFGLFLPCLRGTLTPLACEPADFDRNGRVDITDFFGGLRPALGSAPGPGATGLP